MNKSDKKQCGMMSTIPKIRMEYRKLIIAKEFPNYNSIDKVFNIYVFENKLFTTTFR